MHSCKIIWLGIFWLEIVCEAAGRVARSGVAEVKGQPDSRAIRASNEGYPKVPENFTITEKAPTRAFSYLHLVLGYTALTKLECHL